MDKNLKTGETIDEKNERIQYLERDLQRRDDEIALRKEVIDSLSQNLMQHEKTSGELAQKLVMLKNQMIDHSIGQALKRKYAAVKRGTLKGVPVIVSYSF